MVSVSICCAISQTLATNQWCDRRQRYGGGEEYGLVVQTRVAYIPTCMADWQVTADIDVKLSWPVCSAARTKHMMVHRMMIHLTVLQAGRLLLAAGSVAPRPLLAKRKLIAATLWDHCFCACDCVLRYSLVLKSIGRMANGGWTCVWSFMRPGLILQSTEIGAGLVSVPRLVHSVLLGPHVICDCIYCIGVVDCIDREGQRVAGGERFAPDEDPCKTCYCVDGIAQLCTLVQCSPPSCPKWKPILNQCCKFRCLDWPHFGDDANKSSRGNLLLHL